MAAGPSLNISVYLIAHLLALVILVLLVVRALGSYWKSRETRDLVTLIVYSSFAISELALVWFATIHGSPFVFEPYPWFHSIPWLLTASAVFLSSAAMAFLSSWLMDMKRLCVVPWIILGVSVTYLFLIDYLLRTISPFGSVTSAQPTVKVIVRQIMAVTSTIFLTLGVMGYITMIYLYTKIRSVRILAFLIATGIIGFIDFFGDAILHLLPSAIAGEVNPSHRLHLGMLISIPVNVVYLSAMLLLLLSEFGVLDKIFSQRKLKVVEESWIDRALKELE